MADLLNHDVSMYTGMSMGTSLALEGAFHIGEFEGRPGEVPGLKFELLMINLRTLVRNALNGLTAQRLDDVKSDSAFDAVMFDYDKIKNIVADYNPSCEVQLYLCTYGGLSEAFPNANFRKENPTVKQMLIESIERDIIDIFQDDYKEEITEYKWELSGSKRCVLLTHLPFDMLSFHKFPGISLLESHTGIIKERKDWWTKMAVKKDGPVIPFSKEMLQIFGDKNMLSPQPIKIRKRLLEISEVGRWHSLTTMAKVFNDIKLAHEPHLLEFVRRYS